MVGHLDTRVWAHGTGQPFNLADFVARQSAPVVAIKYSAAWCGPCKKIAPVFHRFADQFSGTIACFEVDTDQSEDLAMTEGIRSLPTFRFYVVGPQEGSVETIDELLGADGAALYAKMDRLYQQFSQQQQPPIPQQQSTQQQIPQQQPPIQLPQRQSTELLHTLTNDLRILQNELAVITRKIGQLAEAIQNYNQ